MSETKENIQEQKTETAKRGRTERGGYVQQPIVPLAGEPVVSLPNGETITTTVTQTPLSQPPNTETVEETKTTTTKTSTPDISDDQLKAYFKTRNCV